MQDSEQLFYINGTRLTEDEIKLFVGKKSDYYLKKWKASKDPEKRAGWNWVAFLAGIFWLGYRKMYLNAAAFLGLFLVLDLIEIFLNLESGPVIGGAFAGVMGILGNVLYFKHMNKKTIQIKAEITDTEAQEKEIAKAGGSSWAGVVIVTVLGIVYGVVSTFLSYLIQGY